MSRLRIIGAQSLPTRTRQGLVLAFTLLAMALTGYFLLTAEVHRVSSEVLRVALKPTPLETVTAFGHTRQAGAEIVEGTPAQALPNDGASEQGPIVAMSERSTFAAANDSGIIPLSYSLEPAFNPGPDGLRVSKPIALQGGDETQLALYLLNGTRIEVAREDLASALTRLGAAEKAKNLPDLERMSLEQVRRAGLDLRYDAIRDRLMLVQ